ncbi:hypothetical protein AC579_1916 [Pseudocercospora musae]|uniref:Uncharacterized protein n=1 Tax=Pseudocercospora musae TaxID=113226 RepID=A0A139HFN4_9PEZI|nr:hypothetical protein AC579_1916 [Pseudocercospora musae]
MLVIKRGEKQLSDVRHRRLKCPGLEVCGLELGFEACSDDGRVRFGVLLDKIAGLLELQSEVSLEFSPEKSAEVVEAMLEVVPVFDLQRYVEAVGEFVLMAYSVESEFLMAGPMGLEIQTCYVLITVGFAVVRGTNDEYLKITGYTNSYFADDRVTRKSTSGYVFTTCEGAILWKSGRRPVVTLSSIYAEYVGMTTASKGAIHIPHLLRNFRYPTGTQPVPPTVRVGNCGSAGHAGCAHLSGWQDN